MSPDPIRDRIDELYRAESRRVFASLVRLVKNFDLAEEAMHEAFAAALASWPTDGMPANPRAWLVSTGKFRAVDLIRRHARFRDLTPGITAHAKETADTNAERSALEIPDDQLRLIFTCCHPAIDAKVQVPLTLREVCGMTTEEIAHAFLTTKATMAQRIVRGKARIRDADIPYAVPSVDDLPARLTAVLSVIYLIFNEGYSASQGASPTRADLTAEAIRLCRLLLALLPDAEIQGLLALMLLHGSRATARRSPDGDLILIQDQDRSRWDAAMVAEGQALVEQALRSRQFGAYTLQAAIAAVHSDATTAERTDWPQIVVLYTQLLRLEPTPVVELNRAVAVAMRDGPQAGLVLIDDLLRRGELGIYRFAHSARGELLRRLGDHAQARVAFMAALALSHQEPEQRFLTARIRELADQSS